MSSEYFLETKLFSDDVNRIPKENYLSTFPMHWHKFIEVVIMPMDTSTDKTAIIALNNERYSLNPGDILFIWSGEVHGTVECSPSTLRCIQFSPALIEDQKDFFPFINMFRNYHLLRLEDYPELVPNMQGCFEHMYELNSDKTMFFNTQMVITLYEMFIHFGTYLRNNIKNDLGISPLETGKTLKSITKACRYIQDNCDHQLTLTDVAEQVGFSSFYLSRIFKKVSGCNFVEYLTMQRIKKSQALLSNPEITITDVAYRSGFTSISTFNRVFKNYRGCSPSEYRKYYTTK